MPLSDPASIGVLVQVILIDLVLAGDNAVVIGLAAASVHPALRRRAIILGILAATLMRIVFAVLATQILAIQGLLLAGGVLLLWVCWKMWEDLKEGPPDLSGIETGLSGRGGEEEAQDQIHGFRKAVLTILVADVSMSLDNVLAVAGAAREHPVLLAFGLLLSITLMGVAAGFIAGLLNRHRWIAYLGLAIIVFVALRMIFYGVEDLLQLQSVGRF